MKILKFLIVWVYKIHYFSINRFNKFNLCFTHSSIKRDLVFPQIFRGQFGKFQLLDTLVVSREFIYKCAH